jgi:hypothetical protein
LLDNGNDLDVIEIKLSQTLNSGFLKRFKNFPEIDSVHKKEYIVYGGNSSCLYHNTAVHSWKRVEQVFD